MGPRAEHLTLSRHVHGSDSTCTSKRRCQACCNAAYTHHTLRLCTSLLCTYTRRVGTALGNVGTVAFI